MAFHSKLKAFHDRDFLDSDVCRGIRLELEFLKPEVQMQKKRIVSTVVIFGSARLRPLEIASQQLEEARSALKSSPDSAAKQLAVRQAERLLANSKYYDIARDFAKKVTIFDKNQNDGHQFVVITGGGPGIMEAGNRGAADMGGISCGLNITLPQEQEPNRFISKGLSFAFHYFCIRKMHFIKLAKAVAAFPGGFGTMDELFEALTLIQTGIIKPIPVLLFGREFWEQLINWQKFIDDGVISPEDLDLLHYCETAEEGWQVIKDFYKLRE